MIVAKFAASRTATAHGLTQWDYGQELVIECAEFEIRDGTEINFYQGKLSSIAYLKNNHVMIPDIMLQSADGITAYVYVRGEESGETILSIRMSINERPQPDNYVLPEYKEYLRLLPAGGDDGAVPVKMDGESYAVDWGYRADNVNYDGEYLQLMSGKVPVGERVRLMKEEREIELANDGTNIKWRYTDSNEWYVLVSLENLKGPPGITPEFEVRKGHLFVKYDE